jgi:beta-1,4-mannosyltransferase
MIIPFVLAALAGALTVVILYYTSTFFYNAIPTRYRPARKPEDEHIQILVVGDIGRSPRMQYHAISAAKHGRHVDLVGYRGEPPTHLDSTRMISKRYTETARHPGLIGKSNVNLYPLSPQPEWIAWGTMPLLAIPYKVIHQFCTLFYTLMYATPAPQWIIIQV